MPLLLPLCSAACSSTSHRKKEVIMSQQKRSSSFWPHGLAILDWQNRTKGIQKDSYIWGCTYKLINLRTTVIAHEESRSRCSQALQDSLFSLVYFQSLPLCEIMKRLNVSLASDSLHFLKMYCCIHKSQYSVNFIYLPGILIRHLVGIFLCKRFLGQKMNFKIKIKRPPKLSQL